MIPQRPEGNPEDYDRDTRLAELFRCSDITSETSYGISYFISRYCKILDNDARGWIPFVLWDTDVGDKFDNQVSLANKLSKGGRFIILKARQLGMTWLVLAVFLWAMLFEPVVTVLIISRGEYESIEALSRLKGMYRRLPTWMRAEAQPTNSKKEWHLSNGSSARALSTRRGDSYTATHVLIDEAALIHEAGIALSDVLLKVEPTVGQQGMLVLLSKADKDRPKSTFNGIFRASLKGESSYKPAFLPYYAHPNRDDEWYERKKRDSIAIDGSVDSLYENYPRTPEEALSPKSSSKRLSTDLLLRGYVQQDPLLCVLPGEILWQNDEELNPDVPYMPGLVIYDLPRKNVSYLLVLDPAEGGGDSDNSALTVMRVDNKEEVAILADKLEPAQLSRQADRLGHFYNNANVIWERNNHGHAVALWFREHSSLTLLHGWEHSDKLGWINNSVGKSLGYDKLAESLGNGDCIFHHFDTYDQLTSIERATLRAPKHQPDDLATTFTIGVAAIETGCIRRFSLDFIKIH